MLKMLQNFISISVIATMIQTIPGSLSAGFEGGPEPLSHLTRGSSIISPDNDTRINLFLLHEDVTKNSPFDFLEDQNPINEINTFRHVFQSISNTISSKIPSSTSDGKDDKYEWFYIAQCYGINDGERDFQKGLNSNKTIPNGEVLYLSNLRNELRLVCKNVISSDPFIKTDDIKSEQGQEYLSYLKASRHFYMQKWSSAIDQYQTLLKSKDPWIKEVSHYMNFRSLINHAQHNAFDSWGDYNGNVDLEALQQAHTALSSYKTLYPNGRYLLSAKGLVRRLFWLGRDDIQLANEYERLILSIPSKPTTVALIQEIDDKILFQENFDREALQTPILLAIDFLVRMRPYYKFEWDKLKLEISAKELYFKAHPELYNFIKASYSFYVEEDFNTVIFLTSKPIQNAIKTSLQFSLMTLHGMALHELKSPETEDFWQELLKQPLVNSQRGVVEIWLGKHYEANNNLKAVYDQNSVINESSIRRNLMIGAIDKELLKYITKSDDRSVSEQDLALFILLVRNLSEGSYQEFLTNHNQIGNRQQSDDYLWNITSQEDVPLTLFRSGTPSEDYYCHPDLIETVSKLAQNPKSIDALLCLSEFYRLNNFSNISHLYKYSGAVPIYDNVISNPIATDEQVAFALYRSILCYRYDVYKCDGAYVEKIKRKEWFEELKLKFGHTKWANQLKYYW